MSFVLLDGPMGTELARRGLALPEGCWSAAALESEAGIAAVREVHASYVAAGARIARANTFRTQPRFYPETYRELCVRAVALAREAGAEKVLGSMAPIEDCYRPDLAPADAEARRLHRAMASALVDAGVDGIVCETFPSAREVRIAVEEAARTGLPVWAALTAGPDGSLMTPEAIEAAARDAVAAGAAAVLVCCTAADRTLPYVERLGRVGVAFGAYANAGEIGAGLGWGAPEAAAARRYVELARTWVEAGATIVGACCGTGPEHVRRLANG